MRHLPSLLLAGVLATGLAAHLVAQRSADEARSYAHRALPERFPQIARPTLIDASLGALAERGWNLGQVSTSKHVVLAATRECGAQLRDWGLRHGFEVSPVLTELGHGGQEQYSVELRKRCMLDREDVHLQARKIFFGIESIEGATYGTWMAERVR